jgi:hypothetical protein
MLSISQRMQPQSKVSERGEGELKNVKWTFQSAKRASPIPWVEYKYPLFSELAAMHKTCVSRTVRDDLTKFPRLNSNGKNAKSTAVRVARWAGRTVR